MQNIPLEFCFYSCTVRFDVIISCIRPINALLNFFKILKFTLTLIPLTWGIWRAPNNASRWQMGFNSVFKGLRYTINAPTCFGLTKSS